MGIELEDTKDGTNVEGEAMSATAHPTIALRPLLPADVPLLAEIFRASIEELTAEDYSESQREAWAAAADDEAAFGARLAEAADAGRHHGRLAGRLRLAQGAGRHRHALRASGRGRATASPPCWSMRWRSSRRRAAPAS